MKLTVEKIKELINGRIINPTINVWNYGDKEVFELENGNIYFQNDIIGKYDVCRIFLKEGEATELHLLQALKYFEDDMDSLHLLRSGNYTAYIFLETEWVGKFVQYAVVPNNTMPQNIDCWGEEDWVFVQSYIRIEGD